MASRGMNFDYPASGIKGRMVNTAVYHAEPGRSWVATGRLRVMRSVVRGARTERDVGRRAMAAVPAI
jgi:hypothetical protein